MSRKRKAAEEAPPVILFLNQEQKEAVNAALSRFLLLIETSQTEASHLFKTSLQEVLEMLSHAQADVSLIHPTDVQAIMQLAKLNQAQKQASQTALGSEEQAQAEAQFSDAFSWLHTLHNYPVHRNKETGGWRLGTHIGRKD